MESGQHPAQRRLILEELLAHQLSLHKLRAQVQADAAPAIHSAKQLQQALLANLPFTPTNAQSRVVAEIEQDLCSNPTPCCGWCRAMSAPAKP